MGDSMERGHVLVMSLWDDHDVNMLWLDSDYPLDKDPSEPGTKIQMGFWRLESLTLIIVKKTFPINRTNFKLNV